LKKVALIIMSFFLLGVVNALEEVPKNIYYIDNGIYAYLEKNTLSINEESKLYVEYRVSRGENTKNSKLIEVLNLPTKTLILSEDDELFNADVEIESRYVLLDTEYSYSEWSEKEKITNIKFDDIPTPKISSLESNLNYKVDNSSEIDDFFKDYSKIYESKLEYFLELKINDSEWTTEKPVDLNMDDVKIEARVKYKIGTYETKYSNILVFEKHPEKVCPFGSDICCNELANVSVCYWILIASIIIALILIYFDNKKRLNREA